MTATASPDVAQAAPAPAPTTQPPTDPLGLFTRELFELFDRHGLFKGGSTLRCEGGVSRSRIDAEPQAAPDGRLFRAYRNGPQVRVDMVFTDTTLEDDLAVAYFSQSSSRVLES